MAEFRTLGMFLKKKRIDAGHTQASLADALGNMHTQFVSNWERGVCAPPSHSFQELIDILKLNPEDLVDAMVKDCKKVIESKVYKKKNKAKSKLKTG